MAKTVTANYDNQQIVSFTTGKKKFQTNGKAMKTDLSVSVDGSGTETVVISYKGSEITNFGSGTKVLSCANKLMGSDVEAEVVGGGPSWARQTLTVQGQPNDGAAASVGDYALFMGGANGSNSNTNAVVSVNKNLTTAFATPLAANKYRHSAASVGSKYAICAGGQISSSTTSSVDAYDTNLVRSTPSSLATAVNFSQGGSVGSYGLIGGGRTTAGSTTSTSYVNAYDESLTRTTVQLSSAVQRPITTNIGNYVLFAGGMFSGSRKTVDAFDTSLTRRNAPELSYASSETSSGHYGTKTDNYAIINQPFSESYMDIYNASLTKIVTPATIGVMAFATTGTYLSPYAVYCGGNTTDVFVIDDSLVMSKPLSTDENDRNRLPVTVGKYAVFSYGETSPNKLDAFSYQ